MGQVNRKALRQLLTQHFNLSELRTLCFDLSIDYENLDGKGKETKVLALIEYAERYGRMDDLVAECRVLRPHVRWEDVVLAPKASPRQQASQRPDTSSQQHAMEPEQIRYYVLAAIRYLEQQGSSADNIEQSLIVGRVQYQNQLDEETIEDELELLEEEGYLAVARYIGSFDARLNARGRRLLRDLSAKYAKTTDAQHVQYQLSQEEIARQHTSLTLHRGTLASYLHRRAILGAAHATPEVTHGIAEARANIARVKAILRASGVEVADHPDDTEA
jgi:hypothetical protein